MVASRLVQDGGGAGGRNVYYAWLRTVSATGVAPLARGTARATSPILPSPPRLVSPSPLPFAVVWSLPPLLLPRHRCRSPSPLASAFVPLTLLSSHLSSCSLLCHCTKIVSVTNDDRRSCAGRWHLNTFMCALRVSDLRSHAPQNCRSSRASQIRVDKRAAMAAGMSLE